MLDISIRPAGLDINSVPLTANDEFPALYRQDFAAIQMDSYVTQAALIVGSVAVSCALAYAATYSIPFLATGGLPAMALMVPIQSFGGMVGGELTLMGLSFLSPNIESQFQQWANNKISGTQLLTSYTSQWTKSTLTSGAIACSGMAFGSTALIAAQSQNKLLSVAGNTTLRWCSKLDLGNGVAKTLRQLPSVIARESTEEFIQEGSDRIGNNGVLGTGLAIATGAGGFHHYSTRLDQKIETVLCSYCQRTNNIPNDQLESAQFCGHCSRPFTEANRGYNNVDNMAHVFMGISNYGSGSLKPLVDFQRIVLETIKPLNGHAKFDRDTVRLVFGAFPQTTKSEAKTQVLRAVEALQKIQREVSKLNPSVRFHTGIHIGEGTTGFFGHAGEKVFDVLGLNVVQAARNAGEAKKHLASTGRSTTLISQEVKNILERLGFESIGEGHVAYLKGIGDVPVIELPDNLEIHNDWNDEGVTGIRTACTEHEKAQGNFCWHCGSSANHAEIEDIPETEKFLTSVDIDIAGSTQMTQGWTPERIGDLSRRFYETAGEPIAHYLGETKKYWGDGMTADFSSPLDAVLAAIEARDALTKWNTTHPDNPIPFRIGLAHGKARTKGNIAVGEVYDQAETMQKHAPLGSVVIDSTLAGIVGQFFDIKCEGESHIVENPKWQAIALEKDKDLILPLAGREQQWTETQRLWRETLAGNFRTALLVGNEGSGRRAVVARLLDDIGSNAVVLRADVTKWSRDPLHTAIRKHFEQSGTTLENLGTWMSRNGFIPAGRTRPVGFASDVEFRRNLLAHYLGFPIEFSRGMEFLTRNPREMAYWTGQAVGSVIKGLGNTPIIFVIDGMEQAEVESIDFFRDVMTHLNGEAPKVLLLATSDLQITSSSHPLTNTLQSLNTTRISFEEGIGPARTSDFIAQAINSIRSAEASSARPVGSSLRFDSSNISAQLATLLYRQTNGHPGHMMELVREAYVDRAIYFDNLSAEWTLTRDDRVSSKRSSTFHHSLQRRIDQCTATERRVLQAMASIQHVGEETDLDLLYHLLEKNDLRDDAQLSVHTRSELTTVVASLRQRGIVKQKEAGIFEIVPPELAAMVYASIPAKSGIRESLHGAFYEIGLPALTDSQASVGDVANIARHAAYADRWIESLNAYGVAAKRAVTHGTALGNSMVRSIYKDARELLAVMERPVWSFHAFDILDALGTVCERQSGLMDVWESVIGHMEYAETTGQLTPYQKCRMLVQKTHWYIMEGFTGATHHFEDACQSVALLAPHLTEHERAEVLTEIHATRGRFYNTIVHDFTKAAEAYSKAVEYAQASGDRWLLARALMGASRQAAGARQFETARAWSRSAIELFRATQDTVQLQFARLNLAMTLFESGEYQEVEQTMGEILTDVASYPNTMAQGYALDYKAVAEACLGNLPAGLNSIDQAINFAQDNNLVYLIPECLFQRAFILSATNPSQAIEFVDTTLRTPPATLPPLARANLLMARAISSLRRGLVLQATQDAQEITLLRNQNSPKLLECNDDEFIAMARWIVSLHGNHPDTLSKVAEEEIQRVVPFPVYMTELNTHFQELERERTPAPGHGAGDNGG